MNNVLIELIVLYNNMVNYEPSCDTSLIEYNIYYNREIFDRTIKKYKDRFTFLNIKYNKIKNENENILEKGSNNDIYMFLIKISDLYKDIMKYTKKFKTETEFNIGKLARESKENINLLRIYKERNEKYGNSSKDDNIMLYMNDFTIYYKNIMIEILRSDIKDMFKSNVNKFNELKEIYDNIEKDIDTILLEHNEKQMSELLKTLFSICGEVINAWKDDISLRMRINKALVKDKKELTNLSDEYDLMKANTDLEESFVSFFYECVLYYKKNTAEALLYKF